MKNSAWNEAILAEHRSYIREESGRQAFDALVDAAIGLPEFETAPGWHGEIRDFAYNDAATGERPYAFIVNRHDLLFYIRLAGLKRVPGGLAGLKAQFGTARENSLGEWPVRIASKDDADRLNSLLFSHPTAVAAHDGGIPDGITRQDIIGAIGRLDSGETHHFAGSVKYDLVYEGRRYAPKAVIGLAAERLAGRKLGPYDFSGGESSKSTRVLRDLGFKVELKPEDTGPIAAELPGMSNHWWVNNGQSYEHEIAGNYVWCPKTNINGAANWAFDNVALAVADDVVFAYAGGQLRAVGVVRGAAVTADQPSEFGMMGEGRHRAGWRLPVKFEVLEPPLRPKEHMDTLAPLLPEKYSPIQANGDGNQGAYFAAVPLAMAAELRRLLGGQVEAIDAKHRSTITTMPAIDVDQSPEGTLERAIFARTDIGPTQKQTLVNARRGQGLFRERVIQLESRCRVTGVDLVDHLRASHIKPWRLSSDLEKLDGNNGLLLAPHIDHLFDQGYISFTDFGDVIVSPRCPTALIKAWGIDESVNVGPFRLPQRPYLAYHRGKVLKQ